MTGNRTGVRSSALALAFAVLVVLSLAAAVSMVENQRPVRNNGGCAFPDGLSYCQMAHGDHGHRPYSFRPFVPLAARITHAVTHLGTIASFRVLAVAGVVMTVGALAALGYVLARRAGTTRRQAQAIAFAAPALWFVTPFALRFALTIPVLTDEVATGLMVVWLAVLFAPWRPRWSWMLAPAVGVLATTSREAAFVTIAVTCLTAVAGGAISWRDAYANVSASALALAFDLTRRYKPSGYDPLSSWATWLRRWIERPHARVAALLMGLGFAAFALLPGVAWRVMKTVTQPRYVAAVLPCAVVPLLLSTFSGQDVARLSSAATPVLSLLLAFYLVLVASTTQILLLAVAVGIFIRQWNLFGVIPRTQDGYARYFYGMKVFGTTTLAVLALIAVAVVLLDVWTVSSIDRAGSGSEG